MKRIGVFLSARDLDDIYINDAVEFAHLMVSKGYGLVYGGSDRGLMRVVAEAVEDAGGSLLGITMEILKHTRKTDTEHMIIAQDLAERKELLNKHSDAFVVMAGGMGTLDEATDVIELRALDTHSKPVVFLNTNGFYSGLKTQFERMEQEGFLHNVALQQLAGFAEEPVEAISYIEKWWQNGHQPLGNYQPEMAKHNL